MKRVPNAPRRLSTTLRRAGRVLMYVVLAFVVSSGSIAFSLAVTPDSAVSAAGQTVSVGAAAPSFSLSGPGELDLFGQQLPTRMTFEGPVRPRLVLQRITIDRQLTSLFKTPKSSDTARTLGHALAAGWTRYFVWEAVIAAAFALLLIGAVAGWLRLPWRRLLVLLVTGVVVVEAVNLGAVMLAAYGVPARLGQVRSLEALVGRAPLTSMSPALGSVPTDLNAIVMGDSTAAGLGNPGLPHPTRADRACGRSRDSYARDIASVNGWNVLNIACSGATIKAGLLGPQHAGKMRLQPQYAVVKKAIDTEAKKKNASLPVVIISVGANDVGWSTMLRACAIQKTCDNSAFTAYFQQRLAGFSADYLQLLQRLSTMRGHPLVVVNLYYNPFNPSKRCLEGIGLTRPKIKNLVSFLGALNGLLAKGADAASFVAVKPSFSGHALCDSDPYVQGLDAAAPFHPTAAGELAIALADEQAVLSHLNGQTVLHGST